MNPQSAVYSSLARAYCGASPFSTRVISEVIIAGRVLFTALVTVERTSSLGKPQSGSTEHRKSTSKSQIKRRWRQTAYRALLRSPSVGVSSNPIAKRSDLSISAYGMFLNRVGNSLFFPPTGEGASTLSPVVATGSALRALSCCCAPFVPLPFGSCALSSLAVFSFSAKRILSLINRIYSNGTRNEHRAISFVTSS